MGPVINKAALKSSMLGYVEIGKKEGRLVAGATRWRRRRGYYLEPTVFADVRRTRGCCAGGDFGPVLAVIKVAGARSRGPGGGEQHGVRADRRDVHEDRTKLDVARREFHVGNLYFNRKCTGRWWARTRLAGSI
jgi:1-pyrroline-5-carboxylate dehydrogenase